MWADNETSDDLLGFKVHSDLVLDVITDQSLLPVVVGVFGDWGGGKSSVLKMLESDLKDREKDGVVCLYFNGWMFEGYEDAKTALLTSILVALGENKKFGPEIRDKVGGLLRRVKWMDLGRLAVKHIGVPLAIGAATGGVGTVPAILGSLAASAMQAAAKGSEKEDDSKKEGKEDEPPSWSDFINDEKEKPDILEVRKFREDFETMLSESKIGSLVILIDDLDRCLPERIIDTLEAIKLFIAVKSTAFVIGADQRIVEHAIDTRYSRLQTDRRAVEYDLTKDYLEKLIQIPYHLPRLSPAEMESYINLLLCQRLLDTPSYQSVKAEWTGKRQANAHTAFGLGDVRAALSGIDLPQELALQLEWSARASGPLTEGLKGNPRQIKRMLNAMQLRQRLSRVAKVNVRPDILAKLMVLEYTRDDLFRELDGWQTAGQGFPGELKALEEAALENKKVDAFPNWAPGPVLKWLCTEPLLAKVDLRDYFWVARDRTKSTLSEASMVPPVVSAIYRQFIGGDVAEQGVAASNAMALDAAERGHLLKLLGNHIARQSDEDAAPEALKMLVEGGMEGADTTLFEALKSAPTATLSPSAVSNVGALGLEIDRYRVPVMQTLRAIAADEGTPAGQAAKIALEDYAN